MGESRGRTLHEILEAGIPLPPEQAIPLVVELANVLEVRHKQGKVLGGIYPDQVLFEDGMVQLFELAAPRLPEDLTLMYLGFVPPEVLETQPPVPQTDIYSIGLILYALMTGRVPYASGSTEELTQNILHSKLVEFPKFSNFTQLDWIIKKCLVRVPARRFGTAQEVAAELRKVFKPSRGTAQIGVSAPAPGMTVKKLQRRTREYQRLLLDHWKIAAGVGAAIVALIVVLSLLPKHKVISHSTKSWRLTRLTSTADVERDAAPSPDGKMIAFVSNMTGNWELYVRGIGSGTPTQVTESPGNESNPRWSPDGELILFTYEGPGILPTLFSVPPSGGIPQKMADDAVDGQWSPDGRKVCYVTPAAPGVRNLAALDVQELQSKTIVSNIQGLAHPSYSPDGKELVCDADSDQGHRLFLVESDTGKMKPVGNVEGTSPTWESKSGWIYYSARKAGSMKIWRTDPGGFTQQVTEGESQDFHPVPGNGGNSVFFYRSDYLHDIFSLDPDAPTGVLVSPVPGQSSYPRSISSSSLAFVRLQEDHARLETAAISVNKTSVLLDPILPGAQIAVSQDGTYLRVENPQSDRKGLWEIALSGGQQSGLGDQLQLPYEPSPDRKLLLYAMEKDGQTRILLKEMKTQTERELLPLPAGLRIRRAYWTDRGNSYAYLTSDNTLSVYSIKDGMSTKLLAPCYDFSLRPHADQIAALTGADPRRNSLILMDLKTQRRRNLTSFDLEAFATTIDWSRDGKVVYYDRMKASSDLYSAE
ncbi:MAG TPA: hypothetical protein VLR94_10680 [Acidobacteriota bacterium]|nr:hypothetical protein [Acidobacteriota bacterium]